jgi:methylase of polypeptide subunit release factors
MKSKIIALLKKYKVTEPEFVNKVIVTAYIRRKNLNVINNVFLKSYIFNTSQKSTHSDLVNELLDIIANETCNFDFESLINLFEFVISPSDRVINGAIYTPPKIREYIVSNTFKGQSNLDTTIIADIACGCGGFLYNAIMHLHNKTEKPIIRIIEDNIYGLDIQSYSINRTKILLSLLAVQNNEDKKYIKFNLFIGDTLTFKWNSFIENYSGFDYIIGNPPYVCSRNLSLDTKKSLEQWKVSDTGHPDLYIPFFQIGLENLKDNGILAYITMNTFFKSLNGRALRHYFEEYHYKFKIIDFGAEQIFQSRNTYTCLCFIEKKQASHIQYAKISSPDLSNKKISFEKIDYSALDPQKGWNLHNHSMISLIESTGTPFGELYKTRHGLATLKNNVYIFSPEKEDANYYYINEFKIEKESCKDIINSNRLSSQYNLQQLKEKIIFPYNKDNPPKILSEDELRTKYPCTFKYLQCKKEILALRDKGKGDYSEWFAFGRTQSLEKMKYKLFIPKISNNTPFGIISSDENLYFYNGIAIIGRSLKELKIIKKIIESELFWYYIKTTSKPYSSSYYSLNGNYINHFGVCNLSEDEVEFILNETKKEIINNFLFKKYGVDINK